LHFAGPDVQDIFSTLSDTGTAKDYNKAVEALNNYFIPKVNTAYARHTFRQLAQKPGETIQQFVTRLINASKDCGYETDTDNHIRDEVLTKCTSSYLRRKLLEEGETLTLARTLEIANQCEKIEVQMTGLEEKTASQTGERDIDHPRKRIEETNHLASHLADHVIAVGTQDIMVETPSVQRVGKLAESVGERITFNGIASQGLWS